MIKTKKDLKEYLFADKNNNFLTKHSAIMKYIKTLRMAEYHLNAKHKIRYAFWHLKHHNLCNKYLTYVPLNVFGPGLSISHLGCIYIGSGTKCGKNVRISQNITIGSTNGSNECPAIGDNCFIGPNSCIIGNVSVANDVCIGAGCVVVKTIIEEETTWGGVPAKKISNNNSHSNLPLFNK